LIANVQTGNDEGVGALEYSRGRYDWVLARDIPGAREFGRFMQNFRKTPYYIPRVVSTNDLLKSQIRGGLTAPAFVLCDGQTKGRGTNERVWLDRFGQDVLFSVAIDVSGHPRRNVLPLLTGAAIAGNLCALTGLAIGIKWPNDLVIGRRKLGGILIEVIKSEIAVVGIGINVRSRIADFPGNLMPHVTSILEELPGTVAPDALCWKGLLDRLPILIAAAGGALRALIARTPAQIAELTAMLQTYDRTPGTQRLFRDDDGALASVECRSVDYETGELTVRLPNGSLKQVASATSLIPPGEDSD
jgi:biotin-(acetyl-CoA carboxylase) ligase